MNNPTPSNSRQRIPWDVVRCPKCLNMVECQEDRVTCCNPGCGEVYPLISNIPILINEKSSVFCFDDFSEQKATFFTNRGPVAEWINRIIPSVSHNLAAVGNYKILSELTLQKRTNARILVIGGSIAGQGFSVLSENPALELVETDVSFGPRVTMICDGHDLPFADGTFDVVIAQAVLEHVVDPYRCVSEIHRVLRLEGLVYAETPFMQQVHGGRYDFMRFTHRGHRRLFRHFLELRSGIIGGPGMALAWSWQYFLRSFGRSERSQLILFAVGRLTSFYLKYFDYFLRFNPANLDAASGFYFIGKKGTTALNDKDLVQNYTPTIPPL